MRKGRTDNAIIEARITQVYELLVNGARRKDILKFGTDAGWDISDTAIDNYIKRANQKFAEDAATIREEELGRAVARLNNLYARNVAIKDYANALRTQAELNKLLGLHSPARREISGPDGGAIRVDVSRLTDDELEAIARTGGQ